VIELGVLGPLTVRLDGVAVPLPATVRRLTAVLVAHANRAVPVAALVAALWPEKPPPEPRKVLQVYVYRLRKALGAGAVSFSAGGYALHATDVDALRFESLVASAVQLWRGGELDRADAVFGAALGLWRGEPCAGLPLFEVTRLRQRHAQALEQWFELRLELHRYDEVIDGLGALVAEHPFREHARALLMLALYRAGRQVEALRVFRDTRAVFVTQAGVEPGERLRRLHEDILRQRVSLAQVPWQVPAGVRDFVGRAAELSVLDGLVPALSGVPIAAVVGPAGVGKTALVVRWAHAVRDRFPDGQLHVDLRGFSGSPLRPEEVLGRLLDTLGVPARGDLAAVYRSAVAGRRLLVVLDNAFDTAQVLPLLPGAPGCCVVVTSRRTLVGLAVSHDATVVRVPVFTPAESRAFLAARRQDGVDAERCGHLPLALAIAATGPVVGASLDAFETGEHSLRTVLSWSYGALSSPAGRLFRVLGAGSPEFTVSSAAERAEVPVPIARRLVTELAHVHLVAEPSPGRFTIHPLVHQYATELGAVTTRHAWSRAG
jgi:DNA-binding SARP family transcriptional activator